jgi:signal transduction histidine kinase
MLREALLRLRRRLDLALGSETPEAYAELAVALREVQDQLDQERQGDAEHLRSAFDALEAAWFKGAAPPVPLPGRTAQPAGPSRLLTDLLAAQAFVLALSKGDLSPRLKAKGLMAGALKALQANLRHLTWQTQMITRCDFSQRVDFMGEFSESFNAMVQSLAEARDQLLAANQDLEAFSYSVSHDLRTPLRAIQGFSRILLEKHEERLDAEGQRVLGIIITSSRAMNQMIDDLLAFSLSSRQELKKSDCDMTGLSRRVAEELRDWGANRSLELTVQDLLPAHGDPALLRQVLVNLLNNAIKFTAPRNPGRIEVGSLSANQENIYYVKDNGVGFDMQQRDKLFGVFQRLPEASEFEGTGVGLAIVQRIIQRHGGRVWAEGRVNQGATLYFSLPKPAKS